MPHYIGSIAQGPSETVISVEMVKGVFPNLWDAKCSRWMSIYWSGFAINGIIPPT